MVQGNGNFIYIKNDVCNEYYFYLIKKDNISTVKAVSYKNKDDYFTIDIYTLNDKIELIYKEKHLMDEDFVDLMSLLNY